VNLARAKARAALCVVDRFFLAQEYRLNAGRLIDFPAIPKWSDFNDCHVKIAFSSN
jgi:hypothetical protein